MLLGVALVAFFVFVPLGQALEIDHNLGKTGPNGQAHSEHDLCQWLQAHTGSSLIIDSPHVSLHLLICGESFTLEKITLPALGLLSQDPRGPPVFSQIF